ncbi:capsule biosynthesis protein [Paracoccus sp. YIM 132242]|uniref:Capsule biosynthesis protein n=1 Tax=Paracoccus lichenicola TaxID=2665644 RepID=A0A6L6HKY2_9RHOB|nr:capsule biosynthesis protein [Paracoccus lichenicola]MTD98802.1 capsule biosynthesis protein [Paracoccus lichenicola]
MTTPPKARRYHASAAESVRPDIGPAAVPPAGRPFSDANIRISVRKKDETPDMPPRDDDRERFMRTDPVDDGLSHVKPAEAPSPASGEDLDSQLEAIRAENLSERQLRIARRIAALHQIEVASDEEAVLRLRQRGIDPSHRAALGQILSSEGSRAQAKPAANTPAVMPKKAPAPALRPGTEVGPAKPDLPSREVLTEEKRAAEIYRIQRDIAKRRRRRMVLLGLRLLAFVILPTALAGWYYFRVATPLYATVSQFRIQSAEGQGSAGASGLGGMLSGSALTTNTDSVAVQSYLTSREAMLRLDADKDFRAAYQGPGIDPVKRLPPDATNEETFGLYKKSVKIGYDPTEGMIDMEVIAPDPQQSHDFSLALIAYAEEQVDQMTSRLRDDQMQGAIEIYEDAEAKVLAAQRRVQELQQTLGVLDPAAEGTVVMTQISSLESQLATKRLELGQLLANPQPLQSRVTALRGDITRLEEMIAETRTQLTEGDDSRNSLALISGELRIAESDLLTRQELLAGAAAQMESARIEANKQVRYLSLSVAPVPPDEATYPKAFQNTLVAFLIFSGIYLMLSLTASILREQVST